MYNSITLSQALEGYLLYADASRLSPCTIADYTNTFCKFQAFLGDDPPIAAITADQVRTFLASLDHLSKKTLLNYHTGLSALWTWAITEDLVEQHIVKKVVRPKPEEPAMRGRSLFHNVIMITVKTPTSSRGQRQAGWRWRSQRWLRPP